MGTTLSIAVASEGRNEAIRAIDSAFDAVRRLELTLSTWRDDSEIARLNQAAAGESVVLSPGLYALLQEAVRWSRATGGAFDPTIGALTDAWDLRGRGRLPSAAELKAARAASGFGRFAFVDATHSVTRSSQRAWIDTGGFGKGVALREARIALHRAGIRRAVLNFGGQVLAIGSDPAGGDWIVPVAHPSRRSEPVVRLRLHDRSASTSSQSERGVKVGARRLGHIVDPRSGEPVPAWGSVTVIAKDPAVADIVSTALLVLGPDEGLRWAEGRDDLGVLFLIERDGRVVQRWNRALRESLVLDSTFSRGG
jgi:thiamine biosynthesis lipoprotein